MPIVSKPSQFDTPLCFAFCGREIVLHTDGTLPKREDFVRLAQSTHALDWYTERGTSFSYNAMSLAEDGLPLGFALTPLRQYLFEHPDVAHLAARASSILSQRKVFRFCPACGQRLEDDDEQTAARCPRCKRQHFPRIEPATITLVSRGDEILLVKNRNAAYKCFACVSGFIEAGETAEQCVVREVKEETGLRVKNVRYVGSQAWPFPDQLMLAFTAEWEGGEIRVQQEEIISAAWFRRDALPLDDELPRVGSVAWRLVNGKFDGAG